VGYGPLGHLAQLFLSRHFKSEFKVSYSFAVMETDKKKFFKIRDSIESYEEEKDVDIEVINLADSEVVSKLNNNSFGLILNTTNDLTIYNTLINLSYQEGVIVQIEVPHNNDQVSFNTSSILNKKLTLTGSYLGSRKNLSEMLDICSEKGIYPDSCMYEFTSAPEAYEYLENSKDHFTPVINVEKWSKNNGFYKL